MSKKLAWLVGLGMLLLIGFLLACGSNYNPASDGLVLVASQGAGLIESFSFNLSSGTIADVSNSVGATANLTCQIAGIPGFMVLNPAATYVFAIINQTDQCEGSKTGIESFVLNSDGTISDSGTVTSDPNPIAIAMDPSGNYLFVAEGNEGLVNSYAISGGNLTPVPGTFNFVLPTGFLTPNIAALTTTPISFNFANAVCSRSPNATQEFLYAVDSQNNAVYEFAVNMSSGALQNPPGENSVQSFLTGSYPQGVAVDPCNRFAYVSDANTNQISAYTICNGLSTQSSAHCPIPPATPNGNLVPVVDSPFSLTGNANGPGPMVVDALGNYLFVLNQLSSSISPMAISPVTGSLAGRSVYNVGGQPKAMVIRSDDSWLFVTNFNPPTLSQFAVVPNTGALVPVPATVTDNYPWGVAVK
jgi:6-phosphogluconolactonase (cycloisomerase 2 family)